MITYQRYLEAKRVIDDESLNAGVINSLGERLHSLSSIRVVDIGSGIGAMLIRLLDMGLPPDSEYVMVDRDSSNLYNSRNLIEDWTSSVGGSFDEEEGIIHSGPGSVRLVLRNEDAIEFSNEGERGSFDLLVSQLFLDLLDMRRCIPLFMELLHTEGIFYFSQVFDGLTRFIPESKEDSEMISAYHRVMDDVGSDWEYRRSTSGSEMLSLLMEMDDVEIDRAGSSDWVITPNGLGLDRDRKDFLHFLIDTMGNALHEEVDGDHLERWLRGKHGQVREGRLGVIVHQLDVIGVKVT
jgi:hypothetical protein